MGIVNLMKHISRLFMSAGLLLFLSGGFLFSQSLADAARDAQAKKKTQTATGHVYTNESLEFHAAPAEPAPAKSDSDAATAATTDAAAKDSAADAATSDEDKKKAADELKDKVAKQQGQIDLLKRELDVLQRENRMRAAVFYSDAGARLRDPGAYADADRKYQADIAAKQKAIADGQANLDKLREEARRAGVPVS
jgi:predicted metal-dependent phosphoesterase TrpH